MLKNYYGTGHYSLDNYISLVSGQAPQTDTQADCPYYDTMTGSIDTSGSLTTNPNYGQIVSAAGANAKPGANGCAYPASVPTLFNQLDASGVPWKGVRPGPQHVVDAGHGPERPHPQRRRVRMRCAARDPGHNREHDQCQPGLGKRR